MTKPADLLITVSNGVAKCRINPEGDTHFAGKFLTHMEENHWFISSRGYPTTDGSGMLAAVKECLADGYYRALNVAMAA